MELKFFNLIIRNIKNLIKLGAEKELIDDLLNSVGIHVTESMLEDFIDKTLKEKLKPT